MSGEDSPTPDVASANDTPGPKASTPAAIQFALFLFCIAIALPFIGLAAVRDSHDGFKIFGTFLISMGLAGVAAFIGIVCTFIGMARGARGGWTMLAGAMAALSAILIVGLLANAA